MSRFTLLIGIGAQKAGSSWLAHYLAAHPDVHMAPDKELHVFDTREGIRDFRPRLRTQVRALAARLGEAGGLGDLAAFEAALARLATDTALLASDAAYVDHFERTRCGRPVAGEITPAYALVSEAMFARMARLTPDVRFVFILRNPAERLWSALNFNPLSGPRIAGGDPVALADERNAFRVSRYEETLAKLAAAGAERLHVEFYERLFTDEATRAVCAFLDIPWRAPDGELRVNPTGYFAPLAPEVRRAFVRRLEPTYRAMAERYGARLPASWHDDIARHLA